MDRKKGRIARDSARGIRECLERSYLLGQRYRTLPCHTRPSLYEISGISCPGRRRMSKVHLTALGHWAPLKEGDGHRALQDHAPTDKGHLK